jgi:hypothetical protein
VSCLRNKYVIISVIDAKNKPKNLEKYRLSMSFLCDDEHRGCFRTIFYEILSFLKVNYAEKQRICCVKSSLFLLLFLCVLSCLQQARLESLAS